MSTLLTKIGYVFGVDSYIIDNQYCIGGDQSESRNTATHMLYFSPESMKVLKDIFTEDQLVHFINVKNAKKEFNENTEFITKKEDIKEIRDRHKKIQKKIDSIDDWREFKFTQEKVLGLFKGETIELFTDDEDIPSVTISKSIFPITTEKTFDHLVYAVFPEKDAEGLTTLVTCFDCEWFQLYGITQFLDVD